MCELKIKLVMNVFIRALHLTSHPEDPHVVLISDIYLRSPSLLDFKRMYYYDMNPHNEIGSAPLSSISFIHFTTTLGGSLGRFRAVA
jgi:hypothetical protein